MNVADLAALDQILGGFEARPSQAQMASAVADAIANHADLLVEAGTGTGKTLAYLLPILASGQRAVIATATRHLQTQILQSDIPVALAAAGVTREVAVLKGRSNYLCKLRLEHRLEQSRYSLPMVLVAAEAVARHSQTGDRAELVGVAEDDPIWPEITSTADNCLGQECPHQETCFVLQARRKAMAADLIVVNHHLLFADYAVRERWDQGGILPEVGVVVIDEAHGLAETASAFFGASLGERRVGNLLTDLRHAVPNVPDPLLREPLLSLLNRADPAALRLFAVMRAQQQGQVVRGRVQDALGGPAVELAALLAQIAEMTQEPLLATDPLWHKFDESLFAVQQDIERVLFPPRVDDGLVRWIEHRRHDAMVMARPVDVAPILQRTLLAEKAVRIFTSATLAVAGDFRHAREKLGLPAQITTLALPSPFDFPRQALLYVPEAIPEPFAPDRDARVAQTILDLAVAAGGGTMALFSSRRAMQDAEMRLRPELAQYGMELLAQGEAPREVLLDRFVVAQPALLLATMGFWQGVDLPADALRVVVVDKIPFPPPDDPLLQARSEQLRVQGRDPFDELSIPLAATALRQGFGRLIRSQRHWGVVALLDPRLLKRRYGQALLDSLPPAKRTRQFSDVREFLTERLHDV
jgi:ATP-dependent DNA helicase DinG